ncbi:LIM domain and actin-binding protein 1 [Ostrinia furnacalis]|uniref:LIM domain and actin-binding protein 1 n=1 Tax=Ostrinia furnacalis TaxID=93504 RepID=UPI0010387AD3|nr:LIM domain and actin-binding protein 1 [Ostrinia furnacalis]
MVATKPFSFENKIMAMATATATMEASQSLIQTESRVQHSYQEVHVSETRQVKKKKSMRRHKDEGSISVSKSSEKLHKKMKASSEPDSNPQCQKCSRPVYAMERVKAERRVWHKECFRCVQCNKQLTVETYQSDHTTLYCKPHFKQLFEPKPVDGDDETDATVPKKHQMIICESNPVELPPDVVRASDKPDLGLQELSQLDVKSRFEVFERAAKGPEEPVTPEPRAPRERSTALLSKLAKFKAKGMDVGVSDEYLNGVPVEASSSEPEDEEDEDSVLKKSYKHTANREQPVSFCNMSEIVGKFETGQHDASQRTRERKQEIQNIRSRLFMGKQAKIKEMYEQSVLQSEQGVTSSDKIAKELELDAEKARAIKERFESGHVFNDENQPPRNREIDDRSLFNEGIGKKSRSIFLELDANAKNMAPLSPPPQEPPKRKEIPFIPKDVVRSGESAEEVRVETADISDRFRFFETYKPEVARKLFRMTPPRQTQRAKSPSPEVYHEPSVVRSGEGVADARLAADRHTASRMISVFRQLEQDKGRAEEQGPKPLKCFTPPPAGENNHTGDTTDEEDDYSSEYEEDSEEERRRAYYKGRERDEALKQAQQLARTKSFRDRFEHWSESEPAAPRHAPNIERAEQDEDGESQLETAKSLREKFENMKVQQTTVTKTFVPKVNRFV